MRRPLAALGLAYLLVAGLVFAGGPLVVTGPAATAPGLAFVWPSGAPIRYTVDSGPLSVNPSGQTKITNAQGLTRVQDLFNNWHNVSTAAISYSYAGPITGVSGGDVKSMADFNTVQGSCKNGTQNPVIFDSNGSLLKSLGLDPLIIGFASTCKLDPVAGHIVSALILLNGQFQDGVTNQNTNNFELTADQFDEAITHEMGHFSGLGHSQINLDLFQSGAFGSCDTDRLAGLPLMFPIAFCQARKSVGLPILSPDDAAWISKLYPSSTFSTSYGAISGYVYFSDGMTQMQGANVIARRVDDPTTTTIDESRRIAFSAVSGFKFTWNPGQAVSGDNAAGASTGSRDPGLIGYYEIPVTPGQYTVQIEAIDHDFRGGSGVGPIPVPSFLPGPQEFWHKYQSAIDDTTAKDIVTVAAGPPVSNINFILNGTPPRFDSNEDGLISQGISQRPFLVCVIRRRWIFGASAGVSL